MRGCLRVVRDNEIKLELPGPSITVKSNGTLWMDHIPILGIEDPVEKTRIATLVRAGKYDQIPDVYFTRLGENPNGLWTGTDEDWDKHPAKVAQDRKVIEKVAEEAKQVRIYLSARGWGDFSPAEWVGDITRPDAEILAECKSRLAEGDDIDQPNQSDEEIMSKIAKSRADWQATPARRATFEEAKAEDIRRKIASGYCFSCESYCHGDCGHYSADPRVHYARQFKEVSKEANYGIND